MPRPELSLRKVCIGTVQNSRRPKGSPERFLTLEPLRGLALSSTRGVLRRDQVPLGLIVRQSYLTVRKRITRVAPEERNLYSHSDILIISAVRSGVEKNRVVTTGRCSQTDVAPTELDALFYVSSYKDVTPTEPFSRHRIKAPAPVGMSSGSSGILWHNCKTARRNRMSRSSSLPGESDRHSAKSEKLRALSSRE